MQTSTIQLYDLFRNDLKLTDTQARSFVEAIDSKVIEEVRLDKNEVATKDFVKKEITEAKNDIIKWFVAIFITLMLMILGLYATIIFKHI